MGADFLMELAGRYQIWWWPKLVALFRKHSVYSFQVG